jgi:hypothetical protein
MLSFFKKIITVLHECDIDYMLSGSIALSFYTNPRASRDFDFIINLQKKDIDTFINYFKEGFYCDKDAIMEAVENRGMFNIIDHHSGFKADFMILKDQPFRITEFSRRLKNTFFEIPIWTVSAEDLFISKLIWIQDYQSGMQIDDLMHLKNYKNLDFIYINNWVKELKLNTFNII